MGHIKKYWVLYTLLIIGIVWLVIWGFKRSPCNTGVTGLDTCPNNFQLVFSNFQVERQISNPIESSSYPTPVNGKCPLGYAFIQLECITTPCDGGCFPIPSEKIS